MTRAAPPPVVLLWGEDPFLLRDRALGIFGDLKPSEVDGGHWEGGETADLDTPSLFGERRGLLVTDAKSISAAGLKELARYCEAPSPDALLILTAKVAERAKAAPPSLAKLVDPSAIVEVSLKRKELAGWVTARAQAKELRISPAACQTLIGVVGEEAAELDQALDQLVNAFPGADITPEIVSAQFQGLGDQQVWDLCDRAFTRDLPGSIHSLRSLLAAREDPLKILGGVALRVRQLVKVRTLPDHAGQQDVMKAAGLRMPWQAKSYQTQARRFTMAELIVIHTRVVDADRALKLGGSDGDVVLSSLVAAIAG